MNHFQYKNQELYCEDTPVSLISKQIGTPVYIYSRKTLEHHFRVFAEPFIDINHIICYSMKACSNIAVLRIFANLGSGTDIVSGGELFRALRAGIDPQKIVYSGVGKKICEIDEALQANILMFNVESEEELETLNSRAEKLGKIARIALRVNPDVDPKTHPYISTGLKKNKFGIDVDLSLKLYAKAKKMRYVDPIGVDCHIGSQLTELSPFIEAIERLERMIERLKDDGIPIEYLDIGGGLGIPYNMEAPPPPSEYGAAIVNKVKKMGLKLILEPGRVMVGNAGILVTSVLYRKPTQMKDFVIVDAAMNDLIRPSLYKAYHQIQKVKLSGNDSTKINADIVGPICESGDFVAQDREIDEPKTGDLLAIMSAGAYGFTMSSNYNSRPRAAEVLVDGSNFHVIRKRETYEDLIRGENIPDLLLQNFKGA